MKIFKKKKYFCTVCQKKVSEFSSLPEYYLNKWEDNNLVYSIFLFETLNIQNYSCSNCGSSDRDRLIALYLGEENLLEKNKGLKILDIAPSNPLREKLFKNFNNYVTVDLDREDVDYNINIENMQRFSNNEFDLILCSHVLEHVKDDGKAVGEIYRVLKRGGRALFLSPILLESNILPIEANNLTEEERWKYFGQDDHLRIYSKKSFINIIKSTQVDISYFNKSKISGDFKYYALKDQSVLYVAKKK